MCWRSPRSSRRTGEPFVLATVVWRRSPSSGKEGATALDHAGPQGPGMARRCLRGAHRRPRGTAGCSRRDDRRLMFLGPPEELDAHRRDGVVTVPIACQSEGALEVYVEPVVPAAAARRDRPFARPRTPSRASPEASAGGRVAGRRRCGPVRGHRCVPGSSTTSDLAIAGVDARSFVVVATQGHYDEEALERALANAGAATWGWSPRAGARRRSSGTCATEAFDDDALARVHAPAGLDLGHVRDRGDRGRDPGRDRAAPGGGRARCRRDLGGADPARGDRPRVRDDGGRGRRPVPDGARRPARSTSVRPGAWNRSEADPARFINAAAP